MTKDEIVDVAVEIAKNNKSGNNILIMAPVVRGRKGEYYQLLYDFLNAGFTDVRIDGKRHSLRKQIQLDRKKRHDIDLIVDRIPGMLDFSDGDNRLRLAESVEAALTHGNDVVTIITDDKNEVSLSAQFTCPNDGFSFPEIEPRMFSFNSPYGACEECHGLGTESMYSEDVCPDCRGRRLKEEALSVLIDGHNIAQLTALSVEDGLVFFSELDEKLKKQVKTAKKKDQQEIAGKYQIAEVPLREINNRLRFMDDVGLSYLTLERRSRSLSGGEAQRIRLASQIGSRLVGTLYILDEPTIGLHQRDNEKLISTLLELRDLGNTVLVVEHDEDTILASDYLVDIGPGAGIHGGHITAQGPMPELLKDKKQDSLSLQYLRGEKKVPIPAVRRKISKNGKFLTIKDATQNNLDHVTVDIPMGKFVAVTGVSGSGKSTLIHEVLYKRLANELNGAKHREGAAQGVVGIGSINKVVNVDQSAIGRTPRSNPATYVGAWTYIRDLFASTDAARVRGYKGGRFSFNVKGGRCENCQGHGTLAIEMHFLPTVHIICDVCHGKRFERETLEVKYRGKNIYDVLRTTVEEAVTFFHDIPWLHDRLKILDEVGLGYLELGQSATTLSGGEAQRIKLAKELGKRDTRKSLYIFDEPTTGLHFEDVRLLIIVLQRLVSRGNTIVVIEHNLDVIKSADWVIDLGPEGGVRGGKVIAEGTPEHVSQVGGSATAPYLKKALKQ